MRAADADRHAIDLIVTHGAIGGNALIYETPAEAGHTVVSVLPTYQQHYSIPVISRVKPKSGTTALLKYAFDMPSRAFCTELIEATGVMFTPGSALDMEGYVRIGYANSRTVLEQGLARVSEFLRAKAG